MADVRLRPHQSLVANVLNALLMVAVAVPALALTYTLFTTCPSSSAEAVAASPDAFSELLLLLASGSQQEWKDSMCSIAFRSPLLYVNIVFFVNVCVLFWLVSLAQRDTWLIDPYWTFIPPLIAAFYHWHPLSNASPLRAQLSLALCLMWAVRLTHSYFRREEWQFGGREDWRFTQMRQDHPRHWWWMSFFTAYFVQQVMLVGLCLPFHAIHFAPESATSVGLFDIACVLTCAGAIVLGYYADTQLRDFMVANHQRPKADKVHVLDSGVWRFSRHPNYFAEQAWWWSLGLLGARLGWWWVLAGTAFNSIVMARVTVLTEKRMEANVARRVAWREYKARTSMWVPWFEKEGELVPAKLHEH